MIFPTFQVRIISLIGGTGQALCGRSLKKIVGHDLSKTYNLMGTKGKSSFVQFESLLAVLKSKFYWVFYKWDYFSWEPIFSSNVKYFFSSFEVLKPYGIVKPALLFMLDVIDMN